MKVSEAVRSRLSVRAFLDNPVPLDVLRGVLELAARAPSGGNLQPWRLHVLSGRALEEFREIMRQRLVRDPSPDPLEYHIYPANLWEPYRTQRFRVGEMMYALLGIPREDRDARLRWFANNYEFFGAPVGLFCLIDRKMGQPQWSDLGMYLQTVMLLLREHGLSSCPQECWSRYNRVVREFLGAPEELMLFCGMAIGYADETSAVNRLASERMSLDDFASFHGF
jgi:nitroreductase